MWAHSVSEVSGRRHGLVEHLRSTSALARGFADPFGAGELAGALGLLHDAGKADCRWQDGLLVAETRGGRVGVPHKELGARLVLDAAGRAALAILGHHGGLGSFEEDLRPLVRRSMEGAERATADRLLVGIPDARNILEGPSLIPPSWSTARVMEMGIRLTFSALVDADHLDTAAHFAGLDQPTVSGPVDMVGLLRRFDDRRQALLTGRAASEVNSLRDELYAAAVAAASGPAGLYRLPAPTGSGKTITAAGFGLHHAARHGKARVIVAVPFITITEQNAQVYRELLGDENVLEHHSSVETDGRLSRRGVENWDAPFVVTTTVQLFDSLFGRKPTRSRKVHRLANAVIVLDEVQALPVPLLVPILDGLRVLTEHFGTTVLLASATQPAFQHLAVWRDKDIHDVVADPVAVYERLRRVTYHWWLEPPPSLADVAGRVAGERQALVVLNTVKDARTMFRLLAGRAVVRHLSTRMCPAHCRAVLEEVRTMLAADEPVLLVSTQLIEAGVDVDFPVVYRALAPADSLQQAAGRANREGRRPELGRVHVFAASDAGVPPSYPTAVAETRRCFGPGLADPDDLATLTRYYRRLYETLGTDRGKRATTIQRNRENFDFVAVADGPFKDAAQSRTRDPQLAFRMLDEDTVPVVVTTYPGDTEHTAARLLAELNTPGGARRATFRALQQFTVALPRRISERPDVAAICRAVPGGGDLLVWAGEYDSGVGIDENSSIPTLI